MKRKKSLLTVLIILILTTISYSQEIKMEAVTTGRYICWKDGVKIDEHNLLQKASTHCDEISANNPESEVGYSYPEFTRVTVKGLPTITIDTIQVNRRVDTEGKSVGGFVDNVKNECYFLTHEEGMVMFPGDSIINWQYKYNLKKTNNFGKISYENLNIPFQYIDVYFLKVNSTAFNMFTEITEKQIKIKSWVDGIEHKEFNPGSSTKTEHGWEFEFSISYLNPDQEYDFKMEVENENGEIIVYQTTLKL